MFPIEVSKKEIRLPGLNTTEREVYLVLVVVVESSGGCGERRYQEAELSTDCNDGVLPK